MGSYRDVATVSAAAAAIEVPKRSTRRHPRCPHEHSALSRASCRHPADPRTPSGLSGVRELPMIICMPSTTRQQRRYNHRLRNLVHRTGDVTVATDLGVPRSTARGMAARGADRRGLSGCSGPHGAGAPTGGPEAAATRAEAHGAVPACAGSAPNLRVLAHWRTSAGRSRQGKNPARRGSGPPVPPVAGAPAVPAIVARSVPCLGTAAPGMCTLRYSRPVRARRPID
jgi:hypothetical protein